MSSASVSEEVIACVENAAAQGYTGIVYLYHLETRRVIVNWTNENRDENLKCDTENYLLNIFTNTSVKEEPVVLIEPSLDDIMLDREGEAINVEGRFEDTDEMSISSIQEPSTIEDDKISLDNSKLTEDMFLSDSSDIKVSSGAAVGITEPITSVTSQYDTSNHIPSSDSSPVVDWLISSKVQKNSLNRGLISPLHRAWAAATPATEKWVSAACEAKINDAVKTSVNLVCPFCLRRSITKRRLIVHVRQHFAKFFCRCGYNSSSREVVIRHQQKGGHKRPIYEVSESLYADWVKHVKLKNPPYFTKCIPTSCHNFRSGRPKMLYDLQVQSLDKLDPNHAAVSTALRKAYELPPLTKHNYAAPSTPVFPQAGNRGLGELANASPIASTFNNVLHSKHSDEGTKVSQANHNSGSLSIARQETALVSCHDSILTNGGSLAALANQINSLTPSMPKGSRSDAVTLRSLVTETKSAVGKYTNTLLPESKSHEKEKSNAASKFVEALKSSIESMETQIVTMRRAADQLEVVVKQQKLQLQLIINS